MSGRGLQLLGSGPADLLISTGRLTGLVAADLLLVQVFLMARVPMIERSYGQDELARRHRLVGFYSFNLLLAHIALIIVGYTLRDHGNLIRETWTVVTSYGGMLLAVAATIALTVVVVTSIRLARRALRYESWHLLHLYAYAGVGLSIPHEIWTGQDFSTSRLAQVYWWSAYALAAGAIVLYRVGLPIWRTLRHAITVTSVVRESGDVVTVQLAGRGLHRLGVQAGQFLVFRFLDGPGWSRGNPYTLSAAPAPDRLRITIKAAGDGSERAARLTPGTHALIEGPYGTLTARRRTHPGMLLMAAGIGITPMRALLEDTPYAPGEATLIYRYGEDEHAVFVDELRAIAAHRGVELILLPGPRRAGTSWQAAGPAHLDDDAQALKNLVPDIAHRDLYVCGPTAWITAVRKAARGAGAHRDSVHTEEFAW
jgi:predicted ferric reductase